MLRCRQVLVASALLVVGACSATSSPQSVGEPTPPEVVAVGNPPPTSGPGAGSAPLSAPGPAAAVVIPAVTPSVTPAVVPGAVVAGTPATEPAVAGEEPVVDPSPAVPAGAEMLRAEAVSVGLSPDLVVVEGRPRNEAGGPIVLDEAALLACARLRFAQVDLQLGHPEAAWSEVAGAVRTSEASALAGVLALGPLASATGSEGSGGAAGELDLAGQLATVMQRCRWGGFEG